MSYHGRHGVGGFWSSIFPSRSASAVAQAPGASSATPAQVAAFKHRGGGAAMTQARPSAGKAYPGGYAAALQPSGKKYPGGYAAALQPSGKKYPGGYAAAATQAQAQAAKARSATQAQAQAAKARSTSVNRYLDRIIALAQAAKKR